MKSQIIFGIAYTAPFSVWSYGAFLSLISPLLLVTLVIVGKLGFSLTGVILIGFGLRDFKQSRNPV